MDSIIRLNPQLPHNKQSTSHNDSSIGLSCARRPKKFKLLFRDPDESNLPESAMNRMS
jgi:hypothetical protein